MNIDYTVTALMFPAIPLLMGVYSNRFHTLSKLIRELHDEHVYEKHIPPEWKKQFINLSGRITLLRWTILFAAFGFLFNNTPLSENSSEGPCAYLGGMRSPHSLIPFSLCQHLILAFVIIGFCIKHINKNNLVVFILINSIQGYCS